MSQHTRLNYTFFVQVALSFAVTVFCMSQIIGNEKPDQTYWILLSSTIAYWFPSPTQAIQTK